MESLFSLSLRCFSYITVIKAVAVQCRGVVVHKHGHCASTFSISATSSPDRFQNLRNAHNPTVSTIFTFYHILYTYHGWTSCGAASHTKTGSSPLGLPSEHSAWAAWRPSAVTKDQERIKNDGLVITKWEKRSSLGWARTSDLTVNSRTRYRLRHERTTGNFGL